MLNSFLLLEEYYGPPEALRLYEDLAQEHGMKAVESALRAGHITLHRASCGRDLLDLKLHLTEQGRCEAKKGKLIKV